MIRKLLRSIRQTRRRTRINETPLHSAVAGICCIYCLRDFTDLFNDTTDHNQTCPECTHILLDEPEVIVDLPTVKSLDHAFAVGITDGTTNVNALTTNALVVNALNYAYDGTTWNRAQANTGQMAVTLYNDDENTVFDAEPAL